MSTIEELLTTPQVDEEVWELDNRYEVNLAYSDDQGPVEVVGKNIGSMSNQISIQGESMSQYLEFMMPRYYDNIDLSDKTITIHYEMNGAGGEITPINMYRSQDKIKFGWVIPAAASQTFGNLSIGIWARGYVNAEEYIWKSRTASYTIEKGLMIGGGIPEPDENWYLEFVRQMDVRVAEASLYASRAKQSEGSASSSESAARGFMEEARTGASTAVQKAGEALNSASTASASSIAAQESATLAMEYRDGAEEYYERTKGISEGLSGQLVPMGTVTFENLPALEDAVSGWMYNISNEFTTTSQFKEGAGKVIPLGSNVYKTTDGYWDVLAGSPVSGVKGSAEATYRSGNVNITPANLGITVVNNTKDENKNVNHSKTSDSTTKATQDSNGNVIVDTYASKSEASISGTATGTNPTIQDSTNAPLVRLKVKGKTEQSTTSGKNKLKVTANNITAYGITMKVNEDKSVTLNGTATQDFITKIGDFNDNDDNYLLSGCPSGGSTSSYYLVASCRDENNTWKQDNIDIGSGKELSNAYAKRLIQIGVKSGATVPNLTFYPMIRKATITDATYEPFTNGASPNPDYPQEIKCIDKVSVKTCGKNLFNASNPEVGLYLYDNGKYTLNTSYYHATIEIGEEVEFTRSYNNGENINGGYRCTYFDNNGNIIGYETGEELSVPYHTCTTPKGCAYMWVYGFAPQSKEDTRIIQVELGSVATPYQPYTETLAEIDLTEPLYEGDYIEYRADGTGVLHRKMASVVFDGSSDETWNMLGEGTSRRFAMTAFANHKDKKNTVRSSHFVKSDMYSWAGMPDCSCLNADNALGFKYLSLTTLAEWKAWLQSNPVTVVYELATPQEIELTAEQVAEFKKLYTFEPITNVFCDGEVEMIYFKNNPNGRVAGMLQRQIDSIMSTLSSTEEVSDE